jgi:hypothetical protein
MIEKVDIQLDYTVNCLKDRKLLTNTNSINRKVHFYTVTYKNQKSLF